MTIRSQFRFTIWLFGVLLAFLAVSLVVAGEQVSKATRQEVLAEQIAENVAEVEYLTNDFLLYGERQQLARCRARFRALSARLAALDPFTAEEREIVRSMRVTSERLREVFESIVATIATPSTAGGLPTDMVRVRGAWSRMTVQSRTMVGDASRLAHLLRADEDRARMMNRLVGATIVTVFGAYLVFTAIIITRRLLRGVRLVQAGAAAVGSGDLGHVIPAEEADEIGELARALNGMTEQLRATTVSRDALAREMGERRKAEEALRDSEARLRTTVQSMVDEVWIVDANGDVVLTNEAVREHLGVAPGHFRSVNSALAELEVTRPNGTPRPVEEAPLARSLRGEVVRGEVEVVRNLATGVLRWRELASAPLRDDDGTVTGAVVVARDITRRVEADEAIRDLNLRLSRAMRETHHRVKNNLQTIAGLVDMQVLEGTSSVPMEELERIGRHARALAGVHDVLTAEAVAEGDEQRVSAEAVLHKLLPVLQALLQGRTLRYDIQDAMLTIRQSSALAVLVNECVSNAAKHGGRTIEVRFEHAGGTASLGVIDDGPGFPVDFNARASAGTGLALTRSVAEWDLQGSLVCANRPQGGAQVTVQFPLDPS